VSLRLNAASSPMIILIAISGRNNANRTEFNPKVSTGYTAGFMAYSIIHAICNLVSFKAITINEILYQRIFNYIQKHPKRNIKMQILYYLSTPGSFVWFWLRRRSIIWRVGNVGQAGNGNTWTLPTTVFPGVNWKLSPISSLSFKMQIYDSKYCKAYCEIDFILYKNIMG